jgi:hypothetical protein
MVPMGGVFQGVVAGIREQSCDKVQIELIDGVPYNVGAWQHRQRTNKDKLSADRLQKLDAAGFVWNTRLLQ